MRCWSTIRSELLVRPTVADDGFDADDVDSHYRYYREYTGRDFRRDSNRNSRRDKSHTPVSLTVNAPADFTIAASTLSPATVSAGGSAMSTITIAPVNGFNSTVTLSCGITPVVARPTTCSLNPGSVANGSGTSTLTVNTEAPHASLKSPSMGSFYATFLAIGGIALLEAGFSSRREKPPGFLLVCLMFSGLTLLAACGGSSSPLVEAVKVCLVHQPGPTQSQSWQHRNR